MAYYGYGEIEVPQESIHHLAASLVEAVKPMKPPLFKPAISNVRPTASTFFLKEFACADVKNAGGDVNYRVPYCKNKTMGVAPGSQRKSLQDYKGSAERSMQKRVLNLFDAKKQNPDLFKTSKTKVPSRYPRVPRATDEKPICGLVTSKNFIVSNAVENILQKPKTLPTQPYWKGATYGKTPKYLHTIKAEIEKEYDFIRRLQQEQEERNTEREMDEEERENLINALKAKWEDVNRKFQSESHLTLLDRGKKRRKEEREKLLTDLEKWIAKIKNPNIVIDLTC